MQFICAFAMKNCLINDEKLIQLTVSFRPILGAPSGQLHTFLYSLPRIEGKPSDTMTPLHQRNCSKLQMRGRNVVLAFHSQKSMNKNASTSVLIVERRRGMSAPTTTNRIYHCYESNPIYIQSDFGNFAMSPPWNCLGES